MVIVEGPDGAGKTHLIKRLEKDLDTKVEPRVVSKDAEAMTDLVLWVEKDLRSWPRAALYDRHRLISEPIYGPVLRDEPHPGFEDTHWLSMQLEIMRRKGPALIFCLPPLGTIASNLHGDPDNIVVSGKWRQIYWLYVMEAARWPMSYLWDYTRPDADRIYRGMLAGLKRLEHLAATGVNH